MRRRLTLFEFRNATRNQKRIRLIIKGWRSSGVLCVAVWHENDQTLPRAREQDTISVQEVQLVRLVANLLPFGALERVMLPCVVNPPLSGQIGDELAISWPSRSDGCGTVPNKWANALDLSAVGATPS
jgi:hypothetical protein